MVGPPGLEPGTYGLKGHTIRATPPSIPDNPWALRDSSSRFPPHPTPFHVMFHVTPGKVWRLEASSADGA
jgi:hypothetical protein